MATRTLAVLNQKGGVGKTTTCVNLGAALARRGYRVLLVDMDPQANLTVHLGLEPPRLQHTTYSLLIGQHGLAEAVHETGVPGLSVVPSTLALANAEIQLASTVGRELVLRESLEAWLDPTADVSGLPFASDEDAGRPAADFVIIDCPPSLGTLTMNALCAADEVLLPIQSEFFALQGVAGILESIRAVQRLNKSLHLSMVVPSLVDRRTTLARDVIEEVRAYFGDTVTRTEIRKNVKLAEAPSHGQTIFDWDPRCHGAEDYESLAAEVLGEPLPSDEEQEPAPVAEQAQPAAEATREEDVSGDDGAVGGKIDDVAPADMPAISADEDAPPSEPESPEATPPDAAAAPEPLTRSAAPEHARERSPEPLDTEPPVPDTPKTDSSGSASDEPSRSDDHEPPEREPPAETSTARPSGIGLAPGYASERQAPQPAPRDQTPADPPVLQDEPASRRFDEPTGDGDDGGGRLREVLDTPTGLDDAGATRGEHPGEAPDADARRDDETASRDSWWRALRRSTLGS